MSKHKTIGLLFTAILLAGAVSAENFHNLFRVMKPDGNCQIKHPEQTAFEPVIKGKAYPYGTTVKCGPGSAASLVFSEHDTMHMSENTIVTPTRTADGRVMKLDVGTVLTRFNPAETNSIYAVETPVGTCVAMTGSSKLVLKSMPATKTARAEDILSVNVDTASQLRFLGPQFIIPTMKNGNAVVIATDIGKSLTRIFNVNGDYKVFFNARNEFNPIFNPDDPDLSGLHPYEMPSQSGIKIWRENAPAGGRVIFSVLATEANGEGRANYVYAVGADNIVTRSDVFSRVADTNTPPNEASANETREKAEDTDTLDGLFGDETATDDLGTTDAAPVAPAVEDNSLEDLLSF